MFGLVGNLINSLGYIITIAFFLSRARGFKRLIKKEKYKKLDMVLLSLIFSVLAIGGTYMGTDYNGAIANTRNISVVVAAIIGGPMIGFITGLTAGIHRIMIDPYGITAIPCGIATFLGGWGLGYLKKFDMKNKYILGFIGGIIIENISMGLILLMSKPFYLALNIVETIYFPMVLVNALGVSIVLLITENIMSEEDKVAGEEARLVLEIANKTLPYFREVNENSLKIVCRTILESLGAKIVVFTDMENIISYYSQDDEYKIMHRKIKGNVTKEVLRTGKFRVVNKDDEEEIRLDCISEDIISFIIVPLKSGVEVTGALKVYFSENSYISERNKNLVLGLSELISTQLEISRIKKLEEMARDAEITALQTQINPHFLFNALNTIISFVRIDPIQARSTIIDLATYLRYNLDNGNKLVDIEMELEQVKAYVNIEKARFYDKINMHYEIDENVKRIKIPSLTIQPLVENAIQHGVLNGTKGKDIFLKIYRVDGDKIRVIIENNGRSIDQEVIDKIYSDSIESSKIGLYNVHRRIKLIYGKGLEIERLEEGTRITFDIREEE
ncbi:MAG: sensor histidine kinase [Fusobacteriia bacterium 4572_74]|nr:MAG: sensor histidine kinase [Fusobacteriia bacterium 4572_74]